MARVSIVLLVCAASVVLMFTGCEPGETDPDDSPPSTVQVASVEGGAAGASDFLFVIHRKHNKVSRVHMATMEVTSIKVGERPFTMDITPDGETVVVANRGDYTVSVIDTLTAATRKMYVGEEPRDVSIRADGKYAAVPNYSNNSFTLIDLDEMDYEPFLCPDGPIAADFSADGSRAVVASYQTPGLCIFDMDEMEMSTILDLDYDDGEFEGDGWYADYGAQDVVAGPAGSPSADLAFVALRSHDGDDSQLVVVDLVDEKVIERKPIGPAPARLAITPEGDRVYAMGKDLFHGPNWVAEFEIEEDGNVRERFRYDVDRDPTAIAVNPQMDRVYVACRKKDKVKSLHTDRKIHTTIHTWDRPYTLGLNPQGTILFVAHDDDEHGRVTLIDTASEDVIRTKKLF